MTPLLYHADCIDKLALVYQHAAPTVIITDPPYGIKRDKGYGGLRYSFNGNPVGALVGRRKYHDAEWDKERPLDAIKMLLDMNLPTFIFGGNYFADVLPVGTHWLVWNKMNTLPSRSDAELIWTNMPRNSVKMYTCEWNGLISERDTRYHPTQKPLSLMRWLISEYTKEGDVVLDPFMGSGTTGVACVLEGRGFVGIERDEKFFSIAKGRIDNARDEFALMESEAKTGQLPLFGGVP